MSSLASFQANDANAQLHCSVLKVHGSLGEAIFQKQFGMLYIALAMIFNIMTAAPPVKHRAKIFSKNIAVAYPNIASQRVGWSAGAGTTYDSRPSQRVTPRQRET